MMVEVFRTDVGDDEQAGRIMQDLRQHYPVLQVSFDLEDCDKVLRVAGVHVHADGIMGVMHRAGYSCEVME